MQLKFLFYFAFSILILHTACAQTTRTWDGGGSSYNWSDANNWDCNCVPSADEKAFIPSTFSTITINITGAQTVVGLQSYASIIILSSGSLTINWSDTQNAMKQGTTLTIDNGGEFILNSAVFTFESQASNCNLVNNGTISLNNGSLYFYNTLAPTTGIATMVNNGTINSNQTIVAPSPITFSIQSQGTNNGTMSLIGLRGLNTILADGFTNSGIINTNALNIFGTGQNTTSGKINVNDFVNEALQIRGTFTNNGKIRMTNPKITAFDGLVIGIGGLFTSNDTIEVTAQRYPMKILEGSSGTFTGYSYFNHNELGYSFGIENRGTLYITNVSTVFNSSTNLRNLTGSTLTIAQCKQVNLLTLYNQGTTTNHGHITFDPSNLASASITQLGTLTNHGIMVNSSFPVGLPLVSNPGLFSERIMGNHCTNVAITNFLSGSKTNITNAPTSGIFTDMALTISAGTLNWTANTFIPNASCVGLSVLFLDVKNDMCISKVIPIFFQNPITTSTLYFLDNDGDGFGNLTISQYACSSPLGYVTNATDCNDNNPSIYPGAPVLCDGLDRNCDGNTEVVMDNTHTYTPPPMTPPIGDWHNASHWSLNKVPNTCHNVVIPSGKIVQATSSPVQARYLEIQPGSAVNFINLTAEIKGSTQGAGIRLRPTGLFFAISSTINILQTNGHGVDNFGNIQLSNSGTFAVSNVFQNGIQNNIGSSFICNHSIFINTVNVSGKGISNSGMMTLQGNYGAFMVSDTLIANYGTITNKGSINFQNFFTSLPYSHPIIFNQGTFNNGPPDVPDMDCLLNKIFFPTAIPNFAEIGIHNNGTFNNYSCITLFQNRIRGTGLFTNHASGRIDARL